MKKLLVIIFIALSGLLAGGLAARPPVHAVKAYTARDCDSNAVVYCGLKDSYDMPRAYSLKGVAPIYNYFGISRQDANNDGGNMVNGMVNRSGQVYANGRLVGTNAMTAGRQYMPGSRAVTRGGTTFYVRPPAVSFRPQTLSAYVMMRNGRFDYAVIVSCGNPVKATPIAPKPKHKQQPAPQAPVTKPPAPTQPQAQAQAQAQAQTQPQAQAQAQAQANGQAQAQAQSQSQTVIVRPAVTQTTAPAPKPAPTPAPAAAPAAKTIPNTGPGDIGLFTGGAVVFASLAHFLWHRARS